MAEHLYEKQSDIRRNPLCPFKIKRVRNFFDSSCNWHENIEIIVIERGEGKIRYGSREINISAGDIIIVNSETLHRLYSEFGMDCSYMLVDEEFCAKNGLITRDRRFMYFFRSGETMRLFLEAADAYDRYMRDGNEENGLKAAKARLAVLALLIDVCENHSEAGTVREKAERASDEYVKKAISYVREHYSEPVTLETLALVCGITKHYLAREFRRYTGETAVTYLNILRCKNAEVCMAEGMSVTDAAYECGFESASYFSRTYRKLMGIPPSKYKR